MAEKGKLFETKITISVLSQNEPYSFESYEQLAYDLINGDCSGKVVSEDSRVVSREEFETLCSDHGTDPGFFPAFGEEDVAES